jgi:putative DNA primase/helicase
VYDGRRWKIDDTAAVRRKAKVTARLILNEAATVTDDDERKALASFAVTSLSRGRRSAMVELASSERGIPLLPDDLDQDRWLLNVQNGTIDLRKGTLRPHRREDLITALSPVTFNPAVNCDLWLAVLDRIFAGNTTLISFIRRLFGLCLTGEITEQVLPILYGTGANGKTTILSMILEILGPDYGAIAPPGLLLVKRGESHPTDRATLFGKRLVVDMESGEGARLNETLVKQLTGSDQITTRRMREDFWTFSPTHKVMLCTNHKPEIRETKNAIWRRIKLIPFNVTIPDDDQDKGLPAKLREEYPGILAWCVQGCLEWHSDGLSVPEEVLSATKQYRQESDLLSDFLAEQCLVDMQSQSLRTKSSDLYARLKIWLERAGEPAVSQRTFGEAMTEKGFKRLPSNGIWYLGLALQDQDQRTSEDGH